MKIVHMSASIEGLLLQLKGKRNQQYFSDEENKFYTAKEVRKHLKELQKEGHKLIPSEGCDNFDKVKGCLGHITRKNDE